MARFIAVQLEDVDEEAIISTLQIVSVVSAESRHKTGICINLVGNIMVFAKGTLEEFKEKLIEASVWRN